MQGGPDPSPSLVAPAGHSPLGRGFLSGRFKSPDDLDEGDFRRYGPRFTGANLEANQKLAAKVEDIAHDKRITSAQLALAWVLAQGEDRCRSRGPSGVAIWSTTPPPRTSS